MKWAFASLYLLVLWAPLPLGSNRAAIWVVNGVLATLAASLFVIGELRHNTRQNIDWGPAALPASLFTLVAAWMVIQAIPGMPAALQHPIWSKLSGEIPNAARAISINPSSTWTTIAQVVPIALLSMVAMRLAFSRHRAEFLLKVVVAATTAVATYGLVAQYTGFKQVFLIEGEAYPGFVTGTFVGRAAAAAYFVIGIAAATSIIASRLEAARAVQGGRLASSVHGFAGAMRGAGLFLVADLVLAAALLNTGSRGGVIAGAIALVIIALVSLRRAVGKRRGAVAAVTGLLGAVFIIAAISSDQLLGRLQSGVDSGGRLLVYRDTLDMIFARPWLGHGAGTFIDAFPIYHARAPSSAVWIHAHNTYLQTVAELGLPAAAVLLIAIFLLVETTALGLSQGNTQRPVSVAVVAIVAAFSFHAFVDFSLQIQAVGLTAAVLLGAGFGEALGAIARAQSDDDGSAELNSAPLHQQREVINVTIPTEKSGNAVSSD